MSDIRKGDRFVGERERPGDGRFPGDSADPDPDWASYVAWVEGEVAAGRDPDRGLEPPAWEPPAWELADWDLAASPAAGLRFGQGEEADVLPPGPLLAALTEQAAGDPAGLSDAALSGVLQAARRQEVREQYKQLLVVAELARRREAAFNDARERGVPPGSRPGGFPAEELAFELVTTRNEAACRIEDALDVLTRLPATRDGMAAGLIDATRAGYIALYTRSLAPGDAARADEILAAAAPDLRVDQLARKAAALEMKLNPEGVRARKERARREAQRVETGRELSGNASLSGREMATADAMASKAYIDAMAVALRNGGVQAPLGALRLLAMTELTQGRNPLDLLRLAATGDPVSPGPVPADQAPADRAPADPAHPSLASVGPGLVPPGYAGPGGWPGWNPDTEDDPFYDDPLADALEDTARRRPVPRNEPVALPALVNLIIPAGTVLGWGTAPGQAGSWGLLDRQEARDVVTAAAGHPRTRWCVTLVDGNGQAVAHACARGRRSGLLDDLAPQPPPAQLAELLRRLNLTFEPVARGSCDHASAENRYTPSRKLKHLVRARTATCDARACGAQAIYADLDHTVPYPAGQTDQCNLSPRCRTHHRAKQAPDWKVEQVEPGVTRWTLPSGRTHVTTPTAYLV